MANKVDNIVNRVKSLPVVSASTLAASAFTLAGISMQQDTGAVALAAVVASPFVAGFLSAAGGVDLFRDRSKLSKAFSLAAVGSGLASLCAFSAQWTQPGWEALAAPFYTFIGMNAAAAFNIAAHYTQNVNVKMEVTASNRAASEQQNTGAKPPSPPDL